MTRFFTCCVCSDEKMNEYDSQQEINENLLMDREQLPSRKHKRVTEWKGSFDSFQRTSTGATDSRFLYDQENENEQAILESLVDF